jgi:hypothetical protein
MDGFRIRRCASPSNTSTAFLPSRADPPLRRSQSTPLLPPPHLCVLPLQSRQRLEPAAGEGLRHAPIFAHRAHHLCADSVPLRHRCRTEKPPSYRPRTYTPSPSRLVSRLGTLRREWRLRGGFNEGGEGATKAGRVQRRGEQRNHWEEGAQRGAGVRRCQHQRLRLANVHWSDATGGPNAVPLESKRGVGSSVSADAAGAGGHDPCTSSGSPPDGTCCGCVCVKDGTDGSISVSGVFAGWEALVGVLGHPGRRPGGGRCVRWSGWANRHTAKRWRIAVQHFHCLVGSKCHAFPTNPVEWSVASRPQNRPLSKKQAKIQSYRRTASPTCPNGSQRPCL